MSDDPLFDILDRIADPVTGRGLIASGRASLPRRVGARVDLVLDVAGLDPAACERLATSARAALAGAPGVAEVRLVMTSEKKQRRLIAIASGKGGVGKSTVAANLAIALARAGHRTGLVDADIYGPSQPRLLAAGERPRAQGQTLIPVETRFGVPMLSMGQLVEPGKALAWRGPMASGALGQLIDAEWGNIELLVLDLPPGTGDVQLTMVQKHRPHAAIIVSTPQDLALIDAARAIDLFATARVPVLGIVENMSGYVCPHCGETSDPFGRGGAELEAARLGVPFLGRIPLTIAIREASDAGQPPAAGDGPAGEPFRALAERVAGKF